MRQRPPGDNAASISVTHRRFVTLHARRQGFGLLELTVGLAIGGTAVVAAAALLMALGTRTEAINSAALTNDRDANGERLLRLLTHGVDAMTDSIVLRGDAQSMTLRTWCETSLGWSEPCRVRLTFRADAGTVHLIAQRLDVLGEIILRTGARSGHFIYLVDASDGGKWVEDWGTITLPDAVAAVLDGDTLILPL